MTKNQITKKLTKPGKYKVSFTKVNGKARIMQFDADSVELKDSVAVVTDARKKEIRSFRYSSVNSLEKM